MYVDDIDQVPHTSAHKSKLNYTEAKKYFEESKEECFDNNFIDIESNTSNDTHIEVQ